MRVSKKMIAMVLVIAVLTMATACGSGNVISGGNTTWVYRSGEDTITAGHYITAELVALSSFMEEVDQKIEFEAGKEPRNFKEILELSVDGVTGYQWVEAHVKEHGETYFAVLSEFARLSQSLSPETESQLETYVGQGWDNEKSYFEMNGVSRESYIEYNTDSVRRDQLFTTLYGEGGEKAPSPQELKAAFIADFAVAGIVQIETHSHDEAEELSPEQYLEHSRELANGFLERARLGASAEALQYDYELETTAEELHDTVQILPEGMLSLLVSEYTLDTYAQNKLDDVAQQVLDHKGQEPFLYEAGEVITLIIPQELKEDNENFSYVSSIIRDNMKADEFDAHLVAVAAGLDIAVNEKAVKRYTPDKIKEQPYQANPNQQQEQSQGDDALVDFDLANQ